MPSRLSASSRTPWQGPRASVRHAKWLVAGCPAPVAIGRLAVVSLPLHLSHKSYKPYRPPPPGSRGRIGDRGPVLGGPRIRQRSNPAFYRPGGVLDGRVPRRPRPRPGRAKNYGVPGRLRPGGRPEARERSPGGSAPAPAADMRPRQASARQGAGDSGGRAEAATPRRGLSVSAESPERAPQGHDTPPTHNGLLLATRTRDSTSHDGWLTPRRSPPRIQTANPTLT